MDEGAGVGVAVAVAVAVALAGAVAGAVASAVAGAVVVVAAVAWRRGEPPSMIGSRTALRPTCVAENAPTHAANPSSACGTTSAWAGLMCTASVTMAKQRQKRTTRPWSRASRAIMLWCKRERAKCRARAARRQVVCVTAANAKIHMAD